MDSLFRENSYPQGLYDKPYSGCNMMPDNYFEAYSYGLTYTGTTICNKENITECIIHLNKLLQNLCLPTVNNMSDMTVPLVNIAFDILKRIQQDTKFREELETRTSRITSDYDRLQTSQLRLKDDIEKLERELAIRQCKEKELAAKNRSLCSSIKTEKDEVKRLNSTINHRELQYRHDSKKNEREMNRLKEKLSQVLMEKTHKILGPEILNALPKTDSKRATWKTNSNHVEEFYGMMLRDYEKKMKSLHSENHDLENCMEKMIETMGSLLEQFKLNPMSGGLNEIDPESDGECKTTYDPSESGYETCMSFTKCQEFLRKFNGCCVTLQKYLEINIEESEKLREKNSDAEQETELDSLKNKIQHYKELVAFQEETLKTFANKVPSENASNSFLHETQLIQEYEQLEIKKKLFLEAKGNFEKERLQHMNEAIQLAEEKKLFNQDKIRQQLLEWTPKKNSGELFTALPEFCPASSSGDTTLDVCLTSPSKADVFKNSTPCNEELRCKNLASGDANQSVEHRRNSLLDCSTFTLDNFPYSQATYQSNSNHDLLRSSSPVTTTPEGCPCTSTSAPSGLNSEHSGKDCDPSMNLFESFNSSRILTSKGLRHHQVPHRRHQFPQRRRSDPVCSMTDTEARDLVNASLRSRRGNLLRDKTLFISLKSLDDSLCLKDQLELQFGQQINSLHDTIGPSDL